MGVPPEAEENGAQGQEREANCSLLHAKSENASRIMIAAGGHTVVYGTREEGGGEKKKSDFHYSEKKSSFGNFYSNVHFLIITKNSEVGSYGQSDDLALH